MAPFTVNRRFQIVISRQPSSGETGTAAPRGLLARLKLFLGGLLLAVMVVGVLIVALTIGFIIATVLLIALTVATVGLLFKRTVRRERQ